MRTLKKSLALVLALVMVFSLAITASADFTDAEEIAYPDEVELLVALGIIEGYEDGSFGPQKTLTRAEAAVIVARLNAFFDKTATTTTYTDMEGYNWANWAVAYAENAGIVNGVGGGKFEPATKLTGYMWVKMLLVSMGYDAEEYGMTGAAWQIGVATLDKEVGISGGSFDLSKEISREEACLFAYNALLANRDGQTWAVYHWTLGSYDEVQYGGNGEWHLHWFDNEVDAIAFAVSIGADIEEDVFTGEYVTSLGFEKHGLIGYTIGMGQWGEPYFGWETVAGHITKDWIDPALEIYETVTEDELFALAMEAGLYYNEFEDTEDYLDINNLFIDGANYGSYDVWRGYADEAPFTGNGTRFALYDAGIYGIIGVSVNQYIGVVVADVPAVETTGADPFVVIANACDGSHFDHEEYETYTLYNYEADLGDVVLFNVCYNYDEEDFDIMHIHTPNTVSGTVQQIDLQNTDDEWDDVYTISGTEYVLSQHEAIATIEGAETSVWFVDDCGNLMMKAADIPFEYEIGYLLSYDAENYWKGDEMHTCEEYFPSEKFEIYNIKTGETKVYDGIVTYDADVTTYTMGYEVYNNFPWSADEELDLLGTAYNQDNAAGLSLGLVVYLTDAEGNIFFISDEKTADDLNGNAPSLQIYTYNNWQIGVDTNSIYLYNVKGDGTWAVNNGNFWMNDGTEYVYAWLENSQFQDEAPLATGLKNARDLAAYGEYMVNPNGVVVAVAQFENMPVVEDAPQGPTSTTTALVYASGDYKVVEQQYYDIDAYGNKVGPFVKYLVDGLYIDGEAIGTQVMSKDPGFVPGYIYMVEITTWSDGRPDEWKDISATQEGPWRLDPNGLAVEYIGTGAAGDYLVLENGMDLHMADGANIVCIYDADYTVVGTNESITEIDYSVGKMVVMFVAYDANGLITDLYYYVDGFLF